MKGESRYRDRRAFSIENGALRVTVLVEGGHIAELLHKASGINPLWTPPWPSIEPSTFDPAEHGALYGAHGESHLLSGIMGHNVCLDIFGGPSEEEAAVGLTVHGEASIVPYEITVSGTAMTARAHLPLAGIDFVRTIELQGSNALIEETVRSLSAIDRPIAWTQHVTLGPPFLEKGRTRFRVPATKSRVYEQDFAGEFGRMQPGADFDWPYAPAKDGGSIDLRVYPDAERSGGYTAHLMDPAQPEAFFVAYSPTHRLRCGYAWQRADFPWLGMWEENHSRTIAPWNGVTLTRGMEFGVSPMPESRRAMVERGSLFGAPAFRWLPAKSELKVRYRAFVEAAGSADGPQSGVQ